MNRTRSAGPAQADVVLDDTDSAARFGFATNDVFQRFVGRTFDAGNRLVEQKTIAIIHQGRAIDKLLFAIDSSVGSRSAVSTRRTFQVISMLADTLRSSRSILGVNAARRIDSSG